MLELPKHAVGSQLVTELLATCLWLGLGSNPAVWELPEVPVRAHLVTELLDWVWD